MSDPPTYPPCLRPRGRPATRENEGLFRNDRTPTPSFPSRSVSLQVQNRELGIPPSFIQTKLESMILRVIWDLQGRVLIRVALRR